MADNIATVKKIYECFGKGDVPGILANFAANIEWEWGGVDQGIPWLKPRKGRENIGKFFESLAEHIDLTQFEPFSFMKNDEFVAVVVRASAKHKKTGKAWKEVEMHLWGFDKQGKADRFRHFVDTIMHKAVLP